MAQRRMVPTRFFKDPDILALSTRDTQLILIGLILAADDEGRELAHAELLGREMNYPSEQVEAALQELVANDLLLLYHVGRHRYYCLTRWQQWQTIHPSKLVLSKHPAPPTDKVQHEGSENAAHEQHVGSDTSAQDKLSQVKLSEVKEDEEGLRPANVLTFPTSSSTDTNTDDEQMQITTQVARILKLPVNEALHRVILDYAHSPTLSLSGEADAAREWIEDRTRNRKGQRMNLAFFRRWLQREQEDALHRQAQREQHSATGTHGRDTPDVSPPKPAPALTRSLMGLEAEYLNAQQQEGQVN